MTFLLLVALVAIAYFAWRILDQLPDIVYRLSEIQTDLAHVRRHLVDNAQSPPDGEDHSATDE